MIELYTWSTQNARKVSIMLEECGLDYRIVPVNLLRHEQHDPAFTALNPNGRIPALVDHAASDGPVVVAESGAILIYLAEKTGRFLPASGPARYRVLHWLMWQMSGMGPQFGNLAHFVAALDPASPRINPFLRATMAPEALPYPIRRFSDEAARLIGVLDGLLVSEPFMAGARSIADFATYAWIESIWPSLRARQPSIDDDRPHVAAWMARLAARPALQRGTERLAWHTDPEGAGR